MDDLISRQAAIYVASGFCHSANVAKELAKLPSAQPEVTEEEVKEYCRKRCLCIVDSALLKKYASAQAYVPDTNVGDIISRQAAIDAIRGEIEINGYSHVVDVLEQLPSAQPEIKTDGDTISRQTAIGAIMGQPPEPHYPSWYADQIKALPSAQPERKWTSCSNPPKHHKDVIVRGIEAIGNVTVHKVMQWDVDTWRPTDYAPSVMWKEWSEI